MEAWRNTILSAGSRDDTILERRRFNHTLTLLRAGARLQCMCDEFAFSSTKLVRHGFFVNGPTHLPSFQGALF